MKDHFVVHAPSGRVGKVLERDEDTHTHLVLPNDKKHVSQAERWGTEHVSSALQKHELAKDTRDLAKRREAAGYESPGHEKAIKEHQLSYWKNK